MTGIRSWFLAAVLAGVASVSFSAPAAAEKKPSVLPDPRRGLFVCTVENRVTLSWKSEKGFLYTIMYTDKPTGDARWSPLPGYVQMPGTGQTETLKFETDPAQPRRFNLRVEDASKVKPEKKGGR